MKENQAQEKWPEECGVAIKEIFEEWEKEDKLAEAVAETCEARPHSCHPQMERRRGRSEGRNSVDHS